MSGTGIAGAMDYLPAGTEGADTCAICERQFAHMPVSARSWPGGLGLACSAECAATPQWRGRLVVMPDRRDPLDPDRLRRAFQAWRWNRLTGQPDAEAVAAAIRAYFDGPGA